MNYKDDIKTKATKSKRKLKVKEMTTLDYQFLLALEAVAAVETVNSKDALISLIKEGQITKMMLTPILLNHILNNKKYWFLIEILTSNNNEQIFTSQCKDISLIWCIEKENFQLFDVICKSPHQIGYQVFEKAMWRFLNKEAVQLDDDDLVENLLNSGNIKLMPSDIIFAIKNNCSKLLHVCLKYYATATATAAEEIKNVAFSEAWSWSIFELLIDCKIITQQEYYEWKNNWYDSINKAVVAKAKAANNSKSRNKRTSLIFT